MNTQDYKQYDSNMKDPQKRGRTSYYKVKRGARMTNTMLKPGAYWAAMAASVLAILSGAVTLPGIAFIVHHYAYGAYLAGIEGLPHMWVISAIVWAIYACAVVGIGSRLFQGLFNAEPYKEL